MFLMWKIRLIRNHRAYTITLNTKTKKMFLMWKISLSRNHRAYAFTLALIQIVVEIGFVSTEQKNTSNKIPDNSYKIDNKENTRFTEVQQIMPTSSNTTEIIFNISMEIFTNIIKREKREKYN